MAAMALGKVKSRETAMIYTAHKSLHILNILTTLFLTHMDELSLSMLIDESFEGWTQVKYLGLIVIYFRLLLWQYSGSTTSSQFRLARMEVFFLNYDNFPSAPFSYLKFSIVLFYCCCILFFRVSTKKFSSRRLKSYRTFIWPFSKME